MCKFMQVLVLSLAYIHITHSAGVLVQTTSSPMVARAIKCIGYTNFKQKPKNVFVRFA